METQTPNTILYMIFGSHLYGTNTPLSDKDYKGIFIPTEHEIYTGTIPKSITVSRGDDNIKNTSADVDCELYSLQYFLKLACEGQTVALDMLHSGPQHWMVHGPMWTYLWKNRSWFYTKNLSAFVGYARQQAAKYGIKGSRLQQAQKAADFLRDKKGKVGEYWEQLWENDYCHKMFNGTHCIWQVCGKGVSETSWCHFAADMLDAFVEQYGARAEMARQNKGIDWKAISHALRAGIEAKMIIKDGGFTFPLPEVEYLRQVKAGERDYLTDVAPTLENLMSELETLSKSSTLPDKVDRKKVDRWLVESIKEYYSAV